MGKIRKICLLLIIVLPAYAIGQSFNPDVMKMKTALEKGEYSSLIAYENIPFNQFDQAIYYHIKGMALYHTGDFEGAVNLLLKADDIVPGLASLDLAKSYKLLGNTDEQYTYLARHLESEYKLPRKDIILDPVFSDLDQNRDWIKFWSDDWYSEKENLEAECLYRLSKNDLDPDFWEGSLQKYLNEPEIMAFQARYYTRLEDKRKADQIFSKALQIEPDNAFVLNEYAKFQQERGKPEEAVKLFTRLISKNPYEIDYYLQKAKVLIESANSESGSQELARLNELGIDASDLNLLVAKDLIEKNPDEALRYLDPVIKSTPGKLAFNLRAESKIALGRVNEAISDYAMSLDLDPKQPDVYFNRAQLRLQIGDNKGACYDWNHALQLGHRKAADMLHKHCR